MLAISVTVAFRRESPCGQERPFDITRRIVDNRYVDGGYRMLISDNL